MSFYIGLPSNACVSEFPTNSQSNFSTNLKKPLTLRDGKYEVALTEFVYSPNFFVSFGQIKFGQEIVELQFQNGIEKKNFVEALNASIREKI